MSQEGHAVVHLDACILHRIKQEPTDCNDAPQPECVLFQRQMDENPFEKMLANCATTDECELRVRPENDNQGNYDAADMVLNKEPIGEGSQGHEHQAANNRNQENPTAKARTSLRRSLRQRLSARRLSAEHKQAESDSHQRQSATARMHPGSSSKHSPMVVRVRSENTANRRMLPSVSLEQEVSGATGTGLRINDSNEVFKRRFRKVKCQSS